MSERTRGRVARPARDREATARAILDAALALLATDGFHGFGVNEVARRAGCDKQLIYRYYGGIDGLVDAIGSELATQVQTALDAAGAGTAFVTYGDVVEHMLLALVDVFRGNALLRALTAWELAAPSPLVTRLVNARARQLQAWVAKLRGDLSPPDDVDTGAVNALLIAAVQHLALAGAASGSFAGMRLRSDAEWARAKAQVTRFVRSAYGARGDRR